MADEVSHEHPLPLEQDPPGSGRHDRHRGRAPVRLRRRQQLPPGTHTLQLLLGDKDHIPHAPPIMSKKITITVR